MRLLLAFAALLVVVHAEPKQKLKERTDGNGVTWIGPIRKCPKGDDSVLDACVQKIVTDLTPLVGSGIEDLELRPLDPFTLDKFVFDRSYGPVNISVVSKNIVVHGFSKFKILKFRTDLKNVRMRFMYEVPQLRIESMYKLGGNAFFLPLTGSGPARVEVFNLKAEGVLTGKIRKNKNGEEVIQLEKSTFNKMSIGDMNLHVRGLFDGNAIMSSVVHYVGKRYAPQVFDIVRPDFEELAGNLISQELLNPILNQLPYLVEYVRS